MKPGTVIDVKYVHGMRLTTYSLLKHVTETKKINFFFLQNRTRLKIFQTIRSIT